MKMDGTKIVYEVGDWVVLLFEPENFVVEITKVSGVQIYYKPYNKCSIGCSGYLPKDVRPATQEEINQATKEEKIMVGEYEVEFKGYYPKGGHNTGEPLKCTQIIIGCVTVYPQDFLKIGKKAGWL